MPESRLERLAPWIAGVLISLPTFLAHYPPMADLPLHEAVVGVLRHWGDPAYLPPHLYTLNLGHANQLFYFVILALTYVLPIGTATKLVVGVTILLLPIAAGRLADHMGVTRYAALVIAPIGLGWLFFWGLLANLMGLDMFLFALPLMDRVCQRPDVRGVGQVCAVVILLHFTHDLMALTAGGTMALFGLCSWRGWRAWLACLAPAGVGVFLAVWSRLVARTIINRHHAALAPFEFHSLTHKIVSVPGALYAGYERWVVLLIFAVCQTPVALFALERWRHRSHERRTWPEWAHHFRFEILGASLIFSYFAAPVNMTGTTLIYHRFLTPAWIVLTLSACVRQGAGVVAPWRIPRLLALFVPLAPLLTAWPRFVDSDAVYTDLDQAITLMQKNSTYIVLELGPVKPNWLYSPITGGGHIVAVLGGRGFFDFTQSEAAPVYQRVDLQWSSSFERIDGHSFRFLPAYDFTRYRYAILHSPDHAVSTVAALALQPFGHVIFQKGEWTVLESDLPLVPIEAPDEPTPNPRPKSLHALCKEMIQKIKNMPVDDQALPPDILVPTTGQEGQGGP